MCLVVYCSLHLGGHTFKLLLYWRLFVVASAGGREQRWDRSGGKQTIVVFVAMMIDFVVGHFCQRYALTAVLEDDRMFAWLYVSNAVLDNCMHTYAYVYIDIYLFLIIYIYFCMCVSDCSLWHCCQGPIPKFVTARSFCRIHSLHGVDNYIRTCTHTYKNTYILAHIHVKVYTYMCILQHVYQHHTALFAEQRLH